MAASKQPVGVDHPTIVPTNFEPESESCPTCGKEATAEDE